MPPNTPPRMSINIQPPFEVCISDLEMSLRWLVLKEEHIRNLIVDRPAGPDVSHIPVREVQAYDQMLKDFLAQYTAIMRAYPAESGIGLKVRDMERMRNWHRYFSYCRYSGEHFDLAIRPQDRQFNHGLDSDRTRNARIVMGARIKWVTGRQAAGLDPYPVGRRYPFFGIPLNQEYLANTLPAEKKWIVDWAIVPPLELHYLMLHVSKVAIICEAVALFKSVLMQRGPSADDIVKVEDIAVAWTEQAIASYDEYDRRCDICRFEFAKVHDENKQTEPAVKINTCGHVFGAVCLQTWNKEHNTCPKCRTQTYSHDRLLPVAARGFYAMWLEVLREAMALDEEIDSYFLEAPKERYGYRMRDTFKKLQAVIEKADCAAKDLRKVLLQGTPQNGV